MSFNRILWIQCASLRILMWYKNQNSISFLHTQIQIIEYMAIRIKKKESSTFRIYNSILFFLAIFQNYKHIFLGSE